MSHGRETWHQLPKELVLACNQLGRAAADANRKAASCEMLFHRAAYRARADAFKEAQRIVRAAYSIRLSREATSHE